MVTTNPNPSEASSSRRSFEDTEASVRSEDVTDQTPDTSASSNLEPPVITGTSARPEDEATGSSANPRFEPTGSSNTELWLKDLEDWMNPSRRQIIDVLCPAVSASTSMDVTFDELASNLLRICHSESQRLARMLRTPFLNGQSPIVWTICNFPANLLSSGPWDRLPSVLAVLLQCCGAWELHSTLVDTIYGACCMRNSNSLFQLLNLSALSLHSLTPVYTLDQCSPAAPNFAFEFVICEFAKRMLVDGKVDMQFICESRLYSVGFHVRSRGGGRFNDWMLVYRVLQYHPKPSGFLHQLFDAKTRIVCIDLVLKDGSVRKDVFNFKVSNRNTFEDFHVANFLAKDNEFMGTDRGLRGFIRVAPPHVKPFFG
ncbi:hypothetical protein BKA70DRAFT_1287467 [Coprinopsis sp. MPI-PUGE-AT-0042]|nr:hypothetical protein BKA70DRAFT_1287467 [Coprinopsis sp. MPI-PUGE-AT-0042]